MNPYELRRVALRALLSVTLASLVACTSGSRRTPGVATSPPSDVVQISRTANGVAHIVAADAEMLAYGVAYAHAQDNVCQTAEGLVTTRSERSEYFGAKAMGQ